jgi:hypothetical protein
LFAQGKTMSEMQHSEPSISSLKYKQAGSIFNSGDPMYSSDQPLDQAKNKSRPSDLIGERSTVGRHCGDQKEN